MDNSTKLSLNHYFHCKTSKVEKYRKAEYKAAHIWHSRLDFSILVTLNVHTAENSGQGQCEQHLQIGVWMVTCLYMSTAKAKLNILFIPCNISVIFAFVRMPQLILHYMLNNSISCHSVTSPFPFFFGCWH